MSPRRKIGVVVADGCPIIVEGITAALSKNPKIGIVGAASTEEKCLKIIEKKKPDIALIDLNLFDLRGGEIISKFKSKGCNTKFIILSTSENHCYVQAALKSGAYGFILKDSPIEEIVKAVVQVHAGHTFFSEKISQILLDGYVKGSDNHESPDQILSQREKEILKLIADGLTTKDIANKLGISPRTVDTHRERIMDKLNIHSIAGLTKYAVKYRITNL